MFDPVLLHEWLGRAARIFPEKPAIIAQDERWTYRALDEATTRVAEALAAGGLKRHDRVVVFQDNSAAAVIAFYAVLKAGGTCAIVSSALKAPKLNYILNNSGASVLITHASKGSIVGEALAGAATVREVLWAGDPGNIPPEWAGFSRPWGEVLSGGGAAAREKVVKLPRMVDVDLAALIYTSGSTGKPKGVMSSHHNMVNAARSVIQYLGNRPEDIILNVLPLSFGYGLYQVIMGIMFGGTVVLEKSFLYVHQVLERIAVEKVTGFPIVPTILAMMLKMENLEKYDFSSLRYMSNAGAALPVEHIRRWREMFPHVRLYSMYGLTECKRVCYLPPEEVDRRPDSVGVAMPNCEVFIWDEQGNEVPPGVTGELVVRGSNVMQGYWGDAELTGRAFRAGAHGETLLYTGDYFRRDEEGFLYFLGRKDDMIKTGGERVSAKEVENALCNIRGVVEAAVIAVPDEILGQAIKAFLAPCPEVTLTEKDVLKYCAEKMENFMAPKYIVFVEELPKTANGKVDKLELKDRE